MSKRIEDLRLVEIELFSYCNRTCNWCPNMFVNRKIHSYLDEKIFQNIIIELSKHNYNGAITFSRYNEPLSDVITLNNAISFIKNIMPNCKCITNTNGDYINKEVLQTLLIDELTIMDYDSIGQHNAKQKLLDSGVIIDEIQEKYIYAHINNMKILYYLDWQINRHITDRAGLLSKYTGPQRIRPCFEPKYFVGINYDGTVSPCCNIRNDCSQTQSFILGDLHKNSLSEILESEKSIDFMNKCANADYKNLSCCHTCDNIGGRYTRGNGGISYE